MPYLMSCYDTFGMLASRQVGGHFVKEGIAAHIVQLKADADLGPKPKSVQPIRGEVYSAGGQTGENPVRNHVNELQRQANLKGEAAPSKPVPQERRVVEQVEVPLPLEGENPNRLELRRSVKDPDIWELVQKRGANEIRLRVTPAVWDLSPEQLLAHFEAAYNKALGQAERYFAWKQNQSPTDQDE